MRISSEFFRYYNDVIKGCWHLQLEDVVWIHDQSLSGYMNPITLLNIQCIDNQQFAPDLAVKQTDVGKITGLDRQTHTKPEPLAGSYYHNLEWMPVTSLIRGLNSTGVPTRKCNEPGSWAEGLSSWALTQDQRTSILYLLKLCSSFASDYRY